jgi:hypothetical protein
VYFVSNKILDSGFSQPRSDYGEFTMAKVRLSIEVSKELAALLDSLAENEETSKTEIVRRALSIMKAYKEQATVGRKHIGFTADPTKLDSELVGVLNLPETVGAARNDRENPVGAGA